MMRNGFMCKYLYFNHVDHSSLSWVAASLCTVHVNPQPKFYKMSRNHVFSFQNSLDIITEVLSGITLFKEYQNKLIYLVPEKQL